MNTNWRTLFDFYIDQTERFLPRLSALANDMEPFVARSLDAYFDVQQTLWRLSGNDKAPALDAMKEAAHVVSSAAVRAQHELTRAALTISLHTARTLRDRIPD
jgi:hypothetical protein